jgi:hypothetical protein
MTRIMCNPWKRTFTLAPLAPLTMISPKVIIRWHRECLLGDQGSNLATNNCVWTVC